jgi:DNA primase
MGSLEAIITACRDLLLSFEPARQVQEYLDKRLPRDAQENWRFGYFPPNEHLNVLSSIVGEVALQENDLIYDRRTQEGSSRCSTMANHNMVLPYCNQYGEVIGIVGRTILSEEERKRREIAKYKNTHFKKGEYLFGLDKAKNAIIKSDAAIVVEGQFDTIMANSKGIENIVAIGASNLTFDQFTILYRYTNNIVLLLDDDDAGQAGIEKAIKDFGGLANIKRAILPAGVKDLDEYLKDLKDLKDGEFELVLKE